MIALVAIAGVFAARWALSNSWYVGMSGDGEVTIYQGIPEEIAGWSFAEVEQTTGILEDDLPEAFRDDLEEGKKVGSLEEAETYVRNIEERIEEIENATERREGSGGRKEKGS